MDSAAWLNAHGAANLPAATGEAPGAGCKNSGTFDTNTGVTPPAKNTDGSWPAESCTVPDPTQPGRKGACVTPRTATIVKQIQAMNVGDNGIACWDPHEWNPTSDHPKAVPATSPSG